VESTFPIFVENSRIPVWLSFIAPIEVEAISIGLFVFSRGELSDTGKRHESIHYRQWRELGFIFFPLVYGILYGWGRLKGLAPGNAYYSHPMECEAYLGERDEDYLANRDVFAWVNYG
jgi:hypothetical protein